MAKSESDFNSYKMLMKQIVFCACVFLASGVKFPKFFKKCERDNPDLEACVARNGNEAMKFLADGVNQIRFPSLRPLKVDFMKINVGEGLKLNLTKNEIFGIDQLHVDRVKINFRDRKYVFFINMPRMEHTGIYDVSGRIFLLPVYGHGPINATFINSKIKFSFDYDTVKIKGKEHVVPKNSNYVSVSDRAYFRLENLFNGNERLGKEMNTFLDENWKEVNDEIGVPLNNVIGELLTEIIKGMFSRVPYEDFFKKPEDSVL